MKTFVVVALMGLFLCLSPKYLNAQLRYFEFKIECGHGNWQDTAVVAATSDTALAAAFLRELERPFDQRKFINGKIAHGDGGHNRNADHQFKWHFIPEEWTLTELAVEVCSGCPYSDLDSDPTYWVDTLGFFCPWSARPAREIEEPLTDVEDPVELPGFLLYPNPAREYITIDLGPGESANCMVLDFTGKVMIRQFLRGPGNKISVSILPPGFYSVLLKNGNRHLVRALIIQ